MTVHARAAERTLRRVVPEFSSGRWLLRDYRIRAVRAQRKKQIVYADVSYVDRGRPKTAGVVTKVYGSDRGAHALGAIAQLWALGFRPPGAYRVPEPFGYSRDDGALYQGRAPGVQWADHLAAPPVRLAAASRRAAAWLARLHGSGARAPHGGTARMLRASRRAGAELADAFPDRAAAIRRLARQLVARLDDDGEPVCPSHGDYHPKNVFLTDRAVTAIDLDTFAAREPAFDVGYAIAQLLIMSRLRTGSFAPGAYAGRAFWRAYARARPVPWSRVATQVARSFLQSAHFELVTLRNGRVDLLDPWLEQVALWLASDDERTLDRLGTR